MEGNALIAPGSTPEYEVNRSRFLEYLYRLDGREDPSHPRHSLYTGLAEKYRYQLGQQVMDDIVTRWGEFAPDLEALLPALKDTQESACSPTSSPR